MGDFEKFSIFYILLRIVMIPFNLIGWLVRSLFSLPLDIVQGTGELLNTDPPKRGQRPTPTQTWLDFGEQAFKERQDGVPYGTYRDGIPKKKSAFGGSDEAPIKAGRPAFGVDDDELWKE